MINWYVKDSKVMVQTNSYGASDGSTDRFYESVPVSVLVEMIEAVEPERVQWPSEWVENDSD